MGKFYDHIPANVVSWIQEQKIFYVATAPLLEDGCVNMSPKGCINTFHVVPDKDEDDANSVAVNNDSSRSGDKDGLEEDAGKKVVGKSRAVWYDDMTGSGIETISHLRENGRITVMFVGFEGPPQIVRLFGTGKVYEFGTREYEELLPLNKRQPGSRAVIWVDVQKVGTSCGFSIPFFDYNRPRNKLQRMSAFFEQKDYDYHHVSCSQGHGQGAGTLTKEEKEQLEAAGGGGNEGSGSGGGPQGLKHFWKTSNMKSIDGLPGLEVAYSSSVPFNDWKSSGKMWSADDDSVPSRSRSKEDNYRNNSSGRATLSLVTGQEYLGWDLGTVLVGFAAGLVASHVVGRFVKI